MIKLISFIVLIQFFHFNELKIEATRLLLFLSFLECTIKMFNCLNSTISSMLKCFFFYFFLLNCLAKAIFILNVWYFI